MSRILFDAFDSGGPPSISGIGPAGAATFCLALEAGARITLTFATEVEKGWDGTEQRVAIWGCPRQSYDATAYLIGSEIRTLRPQLIVAAATAQPFLVALPHEELVLTGAGSTVLPVGSTTLCDWALPGQRVVVLGLDGRSFLSAVVQSATSTTITVDVDVSSIAKAGAAIMPAMAVYLDPQQPIGRYAVNVGEWKLAATSILFGFGGVDTMGVGATVLTLGGFAIWDRGVEFLGQVSGDSLQSLAEVIDYGGVISSAGGAPVADWGRQVALESPLRLDWQWFKAFVSAVRGRQLPFLLPTGHSDLLFKAKISNTVISVFGPPTAGAGDPRAMFVSSLAHKWLAILCTDGSTLYADISTIVDNGDGSANIAFATASLTGRTPSKISWLELCRFEADTFETSWTDATFAYNALAHVVQES